MKLKIAVIALAGVILSSCGGGNPEDVVKEFYAALESKDFDKAKSLATDESAQVIDLMAKAPDMGQNDSKLEKVECNVTGETAVCKCYEEGAEEAEDMKMKKEDGAWKVSMSKTDMMEGAMDGLGDMDMDNVMENVDAGLEQLEGAGDKINQALEDVEGLGDELEEKLDDAMNKLDAELEKVK